uniref:THAP domain-containing protein 11 n=1 Tax=Rhipicephalus zambeziensis TaxID=60191 RepID=A0A224ZA07_9ACAR
MCRVKPCKLVRGAIKMSRMNCCVVGCTNSYKKCPPGTKLFRFPARPCFIHQREHWIRSVRRVNEDGTVWQPAKWSRVCSQHFVGGKPSTDPASPSYAPAVFPPAYRETSFIAEDKRSRYERWRKRSHVPSTLSDPGSTSLHGDVGEDEFVSSTISPCDRGDELGSIPDVSPRGDENELSTHDVSTQTDERSPHGPALFVSLSCLLDSCASEASVQCSHIPVPQSELRDEAPIT